uniref:Uncharacterized protein n=1 Tax=Amphora coffeiformis TaxID=265554 RepID=A0A7S3LCT6_9STRA|mmetsp:Transcript_6457/g.12924  ORF Transcript_6457/g.12924 Transcript_6457/m.12924 type:complete len:235 (-) Transcript_6457:94-798(-)|eukprot:scaffold2519_cov168-Amphora_coffeaeformis.AAC.23
MVLKTTKRGIIFREGDGDPATVLVSRHEVSASDDVKIIGYAIPTSQQEEQRSSHGVEKSNKVVRIVEQNNIYWESCLAMDEEEKDVSTRWYSKAELKTMRSNRSHLIQDIIKADIASQKRVTYQTCLIKAFYDCCQAKSLSSGAFDRLSKVLQLCHYRVGMESMAVPVVAKRCRVHRSELQRSIKSIQLLREATESHKLEECLRLVSERYSQPSRLYARLIARAHAAEISPTVP